jgi:long-chain acyl-CoA synthetase
VNVLTLLEMAAGAFGDRVAVTGFDGSELTYQEVFERSETLAENFVQAGVGHVGYLDVSSPLVPVCFFAAARAAVPFVPLNYRLTSDELKALAAQIVPGIAIVNAAMEIILADVEGLRTVRSEAIGALIESSVTGAPPLSSDPDDIAVLLFTSGTTGAPKAAVIRHRHLTSYILGSVEFMGAAEDEATLVSVPPYHVAGMANVCSSIYAGRRMVQLPNFDADDWIDLAEREAVTHAMVVPTMLARIVERLVERGGSRLETLATLSYGGGKMPRSVIEQALELLPNTNFVNAYGLTETSSTIAVLGPEDHRLAIASDDESIRARLDSVGVPLPLVEVTIRDDNGAEVGPGVSGEIWVRGDQVSGEYLGRDSRVTPDGWLPTNDGGSLDEAGYLFIEGRIDDIIVRGGENISPGEIEDVLLSHEAIRDVAAVGVPDVQWGEVVGVALVVHDGAVIDPEEITKFVTARLRSSRAPQYVLTVPELPFNETGKLLRRELRERFSVFDTTSEQTNDPA